MPLGQARAAALVRAVAHGAYVQPRVALGAASGGGDQARLQPAALLRRPLSSLHCARLRGGFVVFIFGFFFFLIISALLISALYAFALFVILMRILDLVLVESLRPLDVSVLRDDLLLW